MLLFIYADNFLLFYFYIEKYKKEPNKVETFLYQNFQLKLTKTN